MPDELKRKIEPECTTSEAGIQASIAISLKRIADRLDQISDKSVFEQVFGR